MRERRETLSFLSFLPRRERPLLAGKHSTKATWDAVDFPARHRSAKRTEYQFQFHLNWDVTFILRTLLYDLVPSAFPSKNGWGGKRAFSRPTHYLREKPWGRGWLLYACVLRSFLCCIWNCIVLYNGFFSQWRKIINPKRLCFLKTFDTFWSVFFREWHLIS